MRNAVQDAAKARPWRARLARWSAALVGAAALLAGCNNNPWPEKDAASNTLFTAVSQTSPRHLDPVASYWSNDTPYTYQIYEPIYGYHYLKRPFTLIPKIATEVGHPKYLDKDGKTLSATCSPAASSGSGLPSLSRYFG